VGGECYIIGTEEKPMSQLVDTHAHLEDIADLEQTINDATRANIIAIAAVGSGFVSNQKVLSLAEIYRGFVYPALGLHPWNLADEDLESSLRFIEANIDKVVAIGEVGLDYDKRVRARADKEQQKAVFQQILRIARNHAKPVLVHSRYAWRDALDMVSEARVEKAVFHWYTGTSSVLRDIISRGYFISATPAVEYHEEHRRAVRGTPLDRLLLETDSPVVYQRGTAFEYEARPTDVLRSLRGVSQLIGMDEAKLAEQTTANALKFFGINR
jgi:TatD DNase family protein